MTDADAKLIVALDFDNKATCLKLVEQLKPELCRLKVGKEMFTHFGPAIVEDLQMRGFDIFLDLKFHDIPNTVARAVSAAAGLGVWMVNVHAMGGVHMLEAARQALAGVINPPRLIAVTVLTSMDANELGVIGIQSGPEQQVERLALLAKAAGLDGVVCSSQEAQLIKTVCGKNFICVTPGIRPAGSAGNDQRRIMTPRQALQNGSDYLVIGRPVTQAPDPLAVLELIHAQMAGTP